MNTRAFLLANLIAGVVMRLLGGLLIISIANCVLCMWVWASAIFAVWLYRRFEGSQPLVTLGQGALLGWVTGVIGAIIVYLLALITRRAATDAIMSAFETAGMEAPAFFSTDAVLVSIIIDLVLYSIFGVVAGLIGAAIFKPKAPAPGSAEMQ